MGAAAAVTAGTVAAAVATGATGATAGATTARPDGVCPPAHLLGRGRCRRARGVPPHSSNQSGWPEERTMSTGKKISGLGLAAIVAAAGLGLPSTSMAQQIRV